MKTIKIKKAEKTEEPRYRTADVAKATGLSEKQVESYFYNRGISYRAGVTIGQVSEMLGMKRRRSAISWQKVEEIRKRLLAECGIEIVEENQ